VPRAFSFSRRLSLFRLCACVRSLGCSAVLLARCSSGSLGWDRRPVRAGSTETICSSAWQGAAASQRCATRPKLRAKRKREFFHLLFLSAFFFFSFFFFLSFFTSFSFAFFFFFFSVMLSPFPTFAGFQTSSSSEIKVGHVV
jgi:hypothetical protein